MSEILVTPRGSDESLTDESRLMADAQRRFEAMVNAFSGDLHRYAVWLCRNRFLAEDLVQETFLRAWRSFDTLRDSTKARSWLITTLRREHARLYERQRPEIAEIDPDDLQAPSHDQTDTLALRAALAELPLMYREPLVMQVLYGFTCDEIGAMLDLPRATVITRVFRARQKMRGILGGQRDLDVDAQENRP